MRRYTQCSGVDRGLVAVGTVLLLELGAHTAEVNLDNLGQSTAEEQ